MQIRHVAAMAALAGMVTGGCVTHEPVYVAPPPVAGTYNSAPAPALAPVPGAPQEPPPGAAVIASQAPPTPPTEVAPPAPGPDYAWTAGYYNWSGAGWIWVPGVWAVRPYRGALWFGGHWNYRGGRAFWVRGHWR
jgi:hypothetical protein